MSNIRLALNLYDITRPCPDLEFRRKLLAGRLDLTTPIIPSEATILVSGVRIGPDTGEKDETAVPFFCELLVAAQIVDVLRSQERKMRVDVTRVYIQRRKDGAWERLSTGVVLTEKRGGKSRLSTRVFPVGIAPSTAPADAGISL